MATAFTPDDNNASRTAFPELRETSRSEDSPPITTAIFSSFSGFGNLRLIMFSIFQETTFSNLFTDFTDTTGTNH